MDVSEIARRMSEATTIDDTAALFEDMGDISVEDLGYIAIACVGNVLYKNPMMGLALIQEISMQHVMARTSPN